MVVFVGCLCLCTLDAVPEETQEPEATDVNPEQEEPSVDLHCDEDLDDGKSTNLLT